MVVILNSSLQDSLIYSAHLTHNLMLFFSTRILKNSFVFMKTVLAQNSGLKSTQCFVSLKNSDQNVRILENSGESLASLP